MSLLEVNGLNTYYGDSHILFDVSLSIETNEVVALIGRNGAGKTTLLRMLSGEASIDSGELIGLIPEQAYEPNAEWVRQTVEFDPERKVLERRLKQPLEWP